MDGDEDMSNSIKRKNKFDGATDDAIFQVMVNGGNVWVKGVKIYVENTSKFTHGNTSGYWVISGTGFRTYFNTANRKAAQASCDAMFGAGQYKVNTPS